MENNKHNLRLLKIAEADLIEMLERNSKDRKIISMILADLQRIFWSLILSAHLDRTPPGEVMHTLKGYREVIYKDYLIFFKIFGNDIVIYRIIKGAEDFDGSRFDSL